MLACPRCGSTYLRDVVHCGLDGERLVPSAQDLLIGRTIDRYAIEGVLGDGGMARVYRARHVHLAQPFALKVLFGDMATDRALAERFRREGQSAAQIKHRNVVSVTDFGVSTEGLSFMAMELLDGPTLAEVARAGKPLSPARVAAIVRQVADGLGAAHALGFVHRDLKPKNVMVVSSGDTQLVKILDFGLVRPLEGTDARLTQQGQIFGTPAYMAPEQITEAEVDPRTDLYALGAMLYELLSGKPPFTGPMAEIFKKHLYERPAPLTDRSGLGELSLVLLSKEREARPNNTREVIEIIDGLGLGLDTDGVLVSMPPALTAGARSDAPAPSAAASPKAKVGAPPRPRAAPPPSEASLSMDDSMSVDLSASRVIDDRAIAKMAAGSRPSLLLPVVFVAAMGAAGWFGYRYYAQRAGPGTAEVMLDAGEAEDAGAFDDESGAHDAGERAAPTHTPKPSTPKKRVAAGAAAAAAVASAVGGNATALGAAGAFSALSSDLAEEDILPPIPSRDAGVAPAVEPEPSPSASATGSPSPSATPSSSPSASPSPSPSATPSTPEPVGGFERQDRELKRVLLERDLHLLDLEPHAPSAVRQWRAWRLWPKDEEPTTAAREAAFDMLREAAVIAALDPLTLAELKIARLHRRVEEVDTPEIRAELDLLVTAAAAARNSTARAQVLAKLTAFELRVDRLLGAD